MESVLVFIMTRPGSELRVALVNGADTVFELCLAYFRIVVARPSVGLHDL